jgi:hypothetical protein
MLDEERHPEFEESRLGWLFGIGIFILFLLAALWATQMRMEPGESARMQLESGKYRIMQEFVCDVEDHASRAGRRYRGKQCFSDLRRIALKDQELGFPRYSDSLAYGSISPKDRAISILSEKARFNESNRIDACWWDTPEFAKESGLYEKWAKSHIKGGPADRPLAKAIRKAGLAGVARWFAIFYLRVVLLAILFYPLMMWRRMKGAWHTIAENPLRYILACLLWPYYIWHYPYGILHELWLEVQMRRVGPLFRRLTSEERTTIRRVSGLDKADYSTWIGDFQQRNKCQFARTAFTAMLGVIILHVCCALLVFPTQCRAEARGAPATVARAGPSCIQAMDSDDGGVQAPVEILPAKCEPPEPILMAWGRVPAIEAKRYERWRKIPHVPYFGWLIVCFITAIQSAGASLRQNGGRQNEAEHLWNHLRSSRAAFDFCLVS